MARLGDAWVNCGPLDLLTLSTVDELFAVVKDQTYAMMRTCEEAGRDPAIPRPLERIVVSADGIGELTKSAPAFLDHAARYAAHRHRRAGHPVAPRQRSVCGRSGRPQGHTPRPFPTWPRLQ